MAIETLNSHVTAALNFKRELPNLWYVMAHPKAWDDEEIPPAEHMETKALEDPIGYKKFESAQLVVPVDAVTGQEPLGNEIVYRGQQWHLVSDSEALEKGARWVYLSVTVEPEDLPYGVYRQVGVLENLQPNPSFSGLDSLSPSQVDDPGILLAYDNRLSQRYANNIRLKEDIVIKF